MKNVVDITVEFTDGTDKSWSISHSELHKIKSFIHVGWFSRDKGVVLELIGGDLLCLRRSQIKTIVIHQSI